MVQIHFDRYKYKIYSRMRSDPLLRSLGTMDESSTRFHACERFDRCQEVNVDHADDANPFQTPRGGIQNSVSATGKRVVYVNPVSGMTPSKWDQYVYETQRRIHDGEEVNCLVYHFPFPSEDLSAHHCDSWSPLLGTPPYLN